MNITFLRDIAVQITSFEKGRAHNTGGSGTLCNIDGETYVLTAEHCVFGKNDHDEEEENNSRFDEIEELIELKINGQEFQACLYKRNISLDYAVLSVNNYSFSQNYFFDKTIPPESVKCSFRGTPNVLGDFKNFPCEVRDANGEILVLKSDDSFRDTSGDDALIQAEGISGSGVFISIADDNYLIGIVRKLRNDVGTFDELECIPIASLLVEFPTVECKSVFEIDNIEKILEEIDISVSDEVIKGWNANNPVDYNRIYLKSSRIQTPSKINKVVYNTIKQYLDGKGFLEIVQIKNPILYNNIEEYIIRKGTDIYSYHTRSIENQHEGRKMILDIQKEIQDELNNLKNIPSEKYILIKQYAIADWLRSCHLNFVDDEDIN